MSIELTDIFPDVLYDLLDQRYATLTTLSGIEQGHLQYGTQQTGARQFTLDPDPFEGLVAAQIKVYWNKVVQYANIHYTISYSGTDCIVTIAGSETIADDDEFYFVYPVKTT